MNTNDPEKNHLTTERIRGFLNTYKYPLLFSFVGVVLLIGSLVSPYLQSTQPIEYPPQSTVPVADFSRIGTIKVDVSGAVKTPGVYTLKNGDRVEDALKAAGGFASQVNKSYVAKYVNLSQKVTDGQKVYLPFDNEVYISSNIDTQSNSLININNASADTLDTLPGVGPVTAQKIITGRPYNQIEDLVTRKAVGKAEFDKIKSQISVN